MQSQEVMFKKEDSCYNYGIYDYLDKGNFKYQNLGAINDDYYIFRMTDEDSKIEKDHFNNIIGNYNTYFTFKKNKEGTDYKLCISYLYSSREKMEPATLFQLSCVIQIVYDFLYYMEENKLVPGLSISPTFLSDNKENEGITDIGYYNSLYAKRGKDANGLTACWNLYKELLDYYLSKTNEVKIEEQKEQIKNIKFFDSILDKVKSTRIYRHYHNKYVIAQHQKRKKLV